MAPNRRLKTEFGDFQTPPELARQVCDVASNEWRPASIVEPTCGVGALLHAAATAFPGAKHLVGLDRNAEYIATARRTLAPRTAKLQIGDFFDTDWPSLLSELPDPLLIIGNPPWVTNSALGSLESKNRPQRKNIDQVRGIDALTGQSNFDLAEAIIRQCLDWLTGRNGTILMLCKTGVARKVLSFAWKRDLPIAAARQWRIDAQAHFGAAVDACLLEVTMRPEEESQSCEIFDTLNAASPTGRLGWRRNRLVADSDAFDRWSELFQPPKKNWRSGIKHDCRAVFEITRQGNELRNGLGETVEIEPELLFPLMKSSDVAKQQAPKSFLLVPQRSPRDSPGTLEKTAPRAWEYLTRHQNLLAARKSSIYRNRHPFSIFGVGDYSFTPWKVAIAGLYKKLEFRAIGPIDEQPVVFDDTCYLLPCEDEAACHRIVERLHAPAAQEFLRSLVFWDAKRPITARLLNSLNLERLAETMNTDIS